MHLFGETMSGDVKEAVGCGEEEGDNLLLLHRLLCVCQMSPSVLLAARWSTFQLAPITYLINVNTRHCTAAVPTSALAVLFNEVRMH